MTIVKVLCLFVVLRVCHSSTISISETFFQETITNEPVDYMSTEPTTEILQGAENSFGFALHEETPVIESFFRLSMTFIKEWDDEFMNKSSIKFMNLANDLRAELIDFVDNALRSSEPNLTNFKLVLACSFSQHETFVTFIVSSKKELQQEDLARTITNRINIEGRIYENIATIQGFVFEPIERQTAEEYDQGKISCETVLNMVLDNQSERDDDLAVENHNNASKPQPKDLKHLSADGNVETCKSDKIQRGSTSIFILEAQEACIEGVRNLHKKDRDHQGLGGLPSKTDHSGKKGEDVCDKSRTGSVGGDETIVVIRKRGNKVFIEI